ncbi:hypothetical protein [Fictibacillus sp. S7]|uniref:hypothetical protein n=1 Tax=Fictibacillus sp. S7 TaxID=2212476 RepID=UPI0010105F9C|nr:hypothetical protein [Fictibacillus sp. S7]RXZ01641.1 hypothetical protein DMO16_19445 [Fictibacillus sp. S7]
MVDPDYLLIKSLIDGFETYEGLLTLSITHWFKFHEKLNPNLLPNKVYTWLEKNNHKPNQALIVKSINRLDKMHVKSENLSLDLM